MGASFDLFSAAVNLCMVAALVIGGARVAWLFLSPVPRPAAELVERPHLPTLGRFAPLLLVLGCAALVGCVLILLWLAAGRAGWLNIFPFLAACALGLGGAGAIVLGIVAQSVVSDAHRGFDVAVETGNLQRNFDAAMLAASGVVMFAFAGWHWVPAFDPATADRDAFGAFRLIARAPLYLAILAALMRSYQMARDTAPGTGKAFNHLATWGGVVLIFVATKVFDGVLPRDSVVTDFLVYRGEDSDAMLKMVPIAYARIQLLALIGLALIMSLCTTSMIDMLARRGIAEPYIPKRAWPGLMFLGLTLAVTFVFARGGAPLGAAFSWSKEVALPVAAGMVLIFAFPALWRTGASAWKLGRRIAARGVLMEILVALPLIALAILLLLVSMHLTRIGLASLLLGGAGAAALGWLRLPSARAREDSLPAIFD